MGIGKRIEEREAGRYILREEPESYSPYLKSNKGHLTSKTSKSLRGDAQTLTR